MFGLFNRPLDHYDVDDIINVLIKAQKFFTMKFNIKILTESRYEDLFERLIS